MGRFYGTRKKLAPKRGLEMRSPSRPLPIQTRAEIPAMFRSLRDSMLRVVLTYPPRAHDRFRRMNYTCIGVTIWPIENQGVLES